MRRSWQVCTVLSALSIGSDIAQDSGTCVGAAGRGHRRLAADVPLPPGPVDRGDSGAAARLVALTRTVEIPSRAEVGGGLGEGGEYVRHS